MRSLQIAIIGAGIGGMTAAIALARAGHNVRVFEQAARFGRVGAAIALAPNAVKVLDGLGLGEAIRRNAFSPAFRVSRDWDTGAETSRIELRHTAERRYGSPMMIAHRADLLAALEAAVPADRVRFKSRLTGIAQTAKSARLTFEDGFGYDCDAVVAADGIHSTTRRLLFGEDHVDYTGMSAYRAIFPRQRLQDYDCDSFVKWWGPDPSSQIVTTATNRGQDMFVFATKLEPEPARESWSAEADVDGLRSAFADYHPQARSVLEACDAPFKTALYVRAPLDAWFEGRVALLGDACHPMLPFMAQGAAMGLEDAAVLSRCLDAEADVAAALALYATTRRPRASLIQKVSNDNTWLRSESNADWVYGFDAWSTELGAPAKARASTGS